MNGQSSTLVSKGALIAGFLAFALAVQIAYTTPTAGYELSIYRSTPIAFWVGIGIGFLTAIGVLLGTDHRRLVDAAMGLIALCALSVVAVPVLRSYFYYGSGDSMTHLGWAREMVRGDIGADGILYPGIHLISIFFSELTGLELTNTLQYTPMLLFPLVYLVAMPLCVQYFTDSRWAGIVGLFAAVLLIPINKISVHVISHPSSQAILFLPFVLFLLFRYLTEDVDGFPLASPIGASFTIAGIGLIFIHPQEAMTFLSMLFAIVGVQLLVKRYAPDHTIATHRSLLAHTVVIGSVFFAWIIQHERALNRAGWVYESLLVAGGETLEETGERGASLAALGGSFEELFIKLFAVSMVFCLLAGGLILANMWGKLDPQKVQRNSIITYMMIGLSPPTLVFFVIFFADQGDHYFRILGFIMAVVTLVGAVALTGIFDHVERIGLRSSLPISREFAFAALGVVLVVMLAAQMVVVHQAPYMYQPNKQVTDAEMSGHEIAFEYHDDETVLMGLRTGAHRFIDAHYGQTAARGGLDFPGYRAGMPETIFNENMTTAYDRDRYLTIKQSDYDREIELYDELRYTTQGFQKLETESEINRIQHNGEFRLYRIDGTE